MAGSSQFLFLALPSFVLLAGLIDDLHSKKIHNTLVVALGLIVLLTLSISAGIDGLKQGGAGLMTALILCLPLFLISALGGGDVKLYAVFGLSTDWNTTLYVFIFSLICGALLGVFRAIISKQGLNLFLNTWQLVAGKFKKNAAIPQASEMHKIPFTVAMFFGWLTYLSLNHRLNWVTVSFSGLSPGGGL